MISLALARGHVVDDSVAPNMVPCILLFYSESSCPDDHADLTFIVCGRSEVRVWIYGLAIGDDGGVPLSEDNGV